MMRLSRQEELMAKACGMARGFSCVSANGKPPKSGLADPELELAIALSLSEVETENFQFLSSPSDEDGLDYGIVDEPLKSGPAIAVADPILELAIGSEKCANRMPEEDGNKRIRLDSITASDECFAAALQAELDEEASQLRWQKQVQLAKDSALGYFSEYLNISNLVFIIFYFSATIGIFGGK